MYEKNLDDLCMYWEAPDSDCPGVGVFYDVGTPCAPALSMYLDQLNKHGLGLIASVPDAGLELPAYDPDMHWTAHDGDVQDNGIYYDPDGPCNPSLDAYLDEINGHGLNFPNAMEVLYFTPDGFDIFAFRIGGGPWQTDLNCYVEQDKLRQVTVLCCPQKSTTPKEEQVQQMNYNTFISTMAELTKKYAGKIMEKEEM